MPTPAELVRSFFDAYARGDREAAASRLADDLTAYVTNARGEAAVVSGRDDDASGVVQAGRPVQA